MKALSARFLISMILLMSVSAGLGLFSYRTYQNRFLFDVAQAEEFTRRSVEIEKAMAADRLEDRVRALAHLALGSFADGALELERVEVSGWHWIRSKDFEWRNAQIDPSQALPALGQVDLKNAKAKILLDPDRKLFLFQVPVTKKLSEAEETIILVEAALPLEKIFGDFLTASVFFVGPDGKAYPLLNSHGALDLRPGKAARRRLAKSDEAAAVWTEKKRSGRFQATRIQAWSDLKLAQSDFHLILGAEKRVKPSFIFLLLAAIAVLGLWVVFFQERLWTFLPRMNFSGQSVKTAIPRTFDFRPEGLKEKTAPTNPPLKETTGDEILADNKKASETAETPKFTTELIGQKPPTLIPRLFMRKRARDRHHKNFTLNLNMDERQSFLRRLGHEISGMESVEALNRFFTESLSRLLDQSPVAFFLYDERDGKTFLKSRHPENLFSKVNPAAFLQAGASDVLGPAMNKYLRDLSHLSPDMVDPSGEWTVFVVGSGTTDCAAWCVPMKMDGDARFFVRMLCEVHFGHHRFLLADEEERRKTFFQEDLVKDRILEEILLGVRLRHPFSLALVETKLWDPQRSTLESMIFGRSSDETLRAKKFFAEKVRRSDRVYILNENQLLLFFPHTAVLDLVQKTERILIEWNAREPNTRGVRAALVEFPTHGDSTESLWRALTVVGERLRKAPPAQVLLASAAPGYLPPFKSRFIRSAMIPENPK